LDWSYQTIPQANLNGRVLTVNAGKALGGSTIINSMIFVSILTFACALHLTIFQPRAEKEQYNAWGTLNNDSSWTWNNLLPFFKRSEKVTLPNAYQAANGARVESDVRGFSGRVKVGFPNFFFPQSTLWRQTAMLLGFPTSPDLSNGEPHAVGVASNSLDATNNTRYGHARFILGTS
jgi:choline dehydrogenase-like flavoprotein